MKEKKNIPQLRFQEFNGEWESKKLGEICKMQAGKFVSASDIYEQSDEDFYPCYGGNGLRGYTKSYNQDGKYSLIGRQGAHCGNVKLANGKFYATEHAVVVYLKMGFDTDYIFHVLNILNLNQYSTGLAQPGLSIQNLETVETTTAPTLPEQQKIANFLTSVDSKLTQLKQKKTLLEQYKKGVMQQIFAQEIRFKNENGNDFPEWEEMCLGDVLIKNSIRNKEQKYSLVQSVSNKFGFINQVEMFEDRRVASKDTSNYYVIEKGCFAYNPSRIDVGSLAYKYDNETSIISPLYISFNANKEYLIDRFLLSWFSSERFIRQMNSSFEGSVRNTLSYESLIKMDISIPTKEEQTKIANFLSVIDDKIDYCSTQVDKMEAWKRGLLQKMFV